MSRIKDGEIVRFKKRVGTVEGGALGIVTSVAADEKTCTILAREGEVACARTSVAVLQNKDDIPSPRKLLLPYGTTTRADGSVTIFNRDYQDLWRIAPDGSWKTAIPWDQDVKGDRAWFPEWKTWHYAWQHGEAVAALNARLASYGITGRPHLWEAIKLAIFDATLRSGQAGGLIYDMDEAIRKSTPPSATLRAAMAMPPGNGWRG